MFPVISFTNNNPSIESSIFEIKGWEGSKLVVSDWIDAGGGRAANSGRSGYDNDHRGVFARVPTHVIQVRECYSA